VPVSSTTWLRDREIIHQNDSNGGLLVRLNEDEVAKVFPQKGFLMGWSRILLRKTKAHKQFDSMKSLLRVGLVTPEPLGVQTFYPGKGAYEGALLYRYVEGVQEVSEALKGPLRETILTHLVRELAVMANGGILFVDFHLGNVLVDGEGNLCWIDVEVKKGMELVRKNFFSRMQRMHRKCNPGVLSEEEWQSFQDGLRSQLKDPGQFAPA
jgi:RIO-like serine/threonine protein kinase